MTRGRLAAAVALLAWLGALWALYAWLQGAPLREFRAEVAEARGAVALLPAEASMPAPTAHLAVVWVGKDEIVVDRSDWLEHPVLARADPDAFEGPPRLARVPLVDGAVPSDGKRGMMISALYDALLDHAETHKHLGQLGADDALDFRGELALGFGPDTSIELVREIQYTAAQAQFSRMELLFRRPDGTLGAAPTDVWPRDGWIVAVGADALTLRPLNVRLDPEDGDVRGIAVPCGGDCAAAIRAPLREISRLTGHGPLVYVMVPAGARWEAVGALVSAAAGEAEAVFFPLGAPDAAPVAPASLAELVAQLRPDDPNLALLREHPELSGAVLVEDVTDGGFRRSDSPGDVRVIRGCYLRARLARPELAGAIEVEGTEVVADTLRDDAVARCALQHLRRSDARLRVSFSP